MSDSNEQKQWEVYRNCELAGVMPVLRTLGFELEKKQPHIQGERYLMQAVTTASGRKLILLGYRISDHKRVVIKVSSDRRGMREIEHEHECRRVLHEIKFAYGVFFSPEEVLFTKRNGYQISIQTFIEQEHPFLERSLDEQFFLAIASFKAQESAHATTYRHIRLIEKTFGSRNVTDYIRLFDQFKAGVLAHREYIYLAPLFKQVEESIQEGTTIIEQYCGFLTHTDFVPHNFRVANGNVYLLDHSSLRFGNKYEGWARFANFMTLHNPKLVAHISDYIKHNRATEEQYAFKLMRTYRLGEIIYYYTQTLEKSTGDLLALNRLRVSFWADVLVSVLSNKSLPQNIITTYRRKRDKLRSESEKVRQINLH